jgi:hypothetical protein
MAWQHFDLYQKSQNIQALFSNKNLDRDISKAYGIHWHGAYSASHRWLDQLNEQTWLQENLQICHILRRAL